MNEEFGARIFEQMQTIFLKPEIEKRKAANLPVPPIFGFQIIFDVGQKPIVHLNEEVQATAIAIAARDIQKDETVSVNDLKKIESIELTDTHPNAGHFTAILINDNWHMGFDFRYNAQRIEQTARRAAEFLEAAKLALEKNHKNAFVENLFTAVELMSKGFLLEMPNVKIIRTKKHATIKSEMNLHKKHNTYTGKYAALLNNLTDYRTNARYGEKDLELSDEKIKILIKEAEEMLQELEEKRPKRKNRD